MPPAPPRVCAYGNNTVESPNNGHVGDMASVPC